MLVASYLGPLAEYAASTSRSGRGASSDSAPRLLSPSPPWSRRSTGVKNRSQGLPAPGSCIMLPIASFKPVCAGGDAWASRACLAGGGGGRRTAPPAGCCR